MSKLISKLKERSELPDRTIDKGIVKYNHRKGARLQQAVIYSMYLRFTSFLIAVTFSGGYRTNKK